MRSFLMWLREIGEIVFGMFICAGVVRFVLWVVAYFLFHVVAVLIIFSIAAITYAAYANIREIIRGEW